MMFKCQCGKELNVIDKYNSLGKDIDIPDKVHIIVEPHVCSCYYQTWVEQYYVNEGDVYDKA